LDISKQITGQLSQHGLNLFISTEIGKDSCLECEWYAINLIFDASIGVAIQYLFLYLTEYLLRNTKCRFKSGDYGNDLCSLRLYLQQLLIWNLIVLIVLKF
jgi:hypothetical protein